MTQRIAVIEEDMRGFSVSVADVASAGVRTRVAYRKFTAHSDAAVYAWRFLSGRFTCIDNHSGVTTHKYTA